MTLLLNPGQSNQRALRTLDGDRVDHRAVALHHAYAKHGADAALAWLSHATQQITVQR